MNRSNMHLREASQPLARRRDSRLRCKTNAVWIRFLMRRQVGRLWYGEPNAVRNAIGYAQFYSRSHDAVIRVYDQAHNLIETHEHKGDFKECS